VPTTDVIKNSQKLPIIKNIVLMNAAGKPPIKKLEKSITQKKKDFLVKKEFVKIAGARIP
jgi:hypothetical protein